MQEQDQDFFSKTRTGDLMTRLTGDLDMVRFAVAWVLRQLIHCTVLFVTTSIVFLVTDWLFALSMLAVTPIIFGLTLAFSKRVHPLYVDLRERLSFAEHPGPGEHLRQPGGKGLRPGGL